MLAFALSTCGNTSAAERLISNAGIDGRWTAMTRDADGSTREWLPPSAGDVWAWSRIN